MCIQISVVSPVRRSWRTRRQGDFCPLPTFRKVCASNNVGAVHVIAVVVLTCSTKHSYNHSFENKNHIHNPRLVLMSYCEPAEDFPPSSPFALFSSQYSSEGRHLCRPDHPQCSSCVSRRSMKQGFLSCRPNNTHVLFSPDIYLLGEKKQGKY